MFWHEQGHFTYKQESFITSSIIAYSKLSKYIWLRAEREARSESTSIYRRKVSMSGRPAGRPAVVTLFERLFLWNGMTNSRMVILIRCHHQINHVFDLYRYPPVPATARGTCRGESVEDTLSLGNSTTAGPIAFKFGVWLGTH